jgi:hypothetical protein
MKAIQSLPTSVCRSGSRSRSRATQFGSRVLRGSRWMSPSSWMDAWAQHRRHSSGVKPSGRYCDGSQIASEKKQATLNVASHPVARRR